MRVLEIPSDNNWEKKLKYGLIFSLILHLIFVFLVTKGISPKQNLQQAFEVSIIPDVPKKEEQSAVMINQIVEPPQNEVDQIDKDIDASLLSDKNYQTDKEQIKRGDRPDAAQALAKTQNEKPQKAKDEIKPSETNKKTPMEKPEKNEPQNEIQKEKPSAVVPGKLSTLRLDNETLIEKFSNSKPSKLNQNSPGASYQAFSRPAGSGAAFIGLSGSSDFLPNLPDGDITLLNAKADKFAVFVRRVASLVFSHLRATGWENLRASDIDRIEDYCTIHAILDGQGSLIKITVEGPSGSTRFDETLLSAVKTGAHDPNPPKAALAEDGKYHFIFKSKSWTKVGYAPKTGAPFERRWLLLSTGLL